MTIFLIICWSVTGLCLGLTCLNLAAASWFDRQRDLYLAGEIATAKAREANQPGYMRVWRFLDRAVTR